jgi:prevent-host-death family protein
MKQVPVAAFKDKCSEFISEAEAGDEIIITRHGKPAAKLIGIAGNRRAKQGEAMARLHTLGQRVRANHGPTTSEEISAWIDEDRR